MTMLRTIASIVVLACGLVAVAAVNHRPDTRPATRPATQPARDLTAAETKKLLAEVSAKLGNVKTVWSRFEQETHISLFAEVVRVKGVCLFAAPDKVRFELVAPFRSVTIVSGKTVGRYEHLAGTWQTVAVPSTLITTVTSQIAAWLQGRFDDANNTYAITARQSGRTTVILR